MMTGRMLVLSAVALVAACHGDSSDRSLPGPVQHGHAPFVKRGPTPDELMAGMVEAVTIGNSTVPVTLKFDLVQRPVVGQALDLTVAITSEIVADPAVLQVTGSDSLQLPPGVGTIEIPAVEPMQVYRHSLTLTPTAEGVHLLALSVSLKHDDVTETRLFSVPLIVAPRAAAVPAAGPVTARVPQPGVPTAGN